MLYRKVSIIGKIKTINWSEYSNYEEYKNLWYSARFFFPVSVAKVSEALTIKQLCYVLEKNEMQIFVLIFSNSVNILTLLNVSNLQKL